MSQWAEIRQMFFVDEISKKEIARRFDLDVKTVRRALERNEAPMCRMSPARGCRLDPWRSEIETWLREDRKLTAKRIRTLLLPHAGPVSARTVRQYVARVRGELFSREAFVHRTHRPGDTMEADFGESWAVVAEVLRKVKFFVATRMATGLRVIRAPLCAICWEQLNDFVWVSLVQVTLLAFGAINGLFVIEEVLLFFVLIVIKHRVRPIFGRITEVS